MRKSESLVEDAMIDVDSSKSNAKPTEPDKQPSKRAVRLSNGLTRAGNILLGFWLAFVWLLEWISRWAARLADGYVHGIDETIKECQPRIDGPLWMMGIGCSSLSTVLVIAVLTPVALVDMRSIWICLGAGSTVLVLGAVWLAVRGMELRQLEDGTFHQSDSEKRRRLWEDLKAKRSKPQKDDEVSNEVP